MQFAKASPKNWGNGANWLNSGTKRPLLRCIRQDATNWLRSFCECFSKMIESIMYIGIGLLGGCLIGVAVVPLVHNRAVRLTVRRLEGTLPQSFEEIQADKDLLRAEFAMSARRLEIIIEQLKNKAASQLVQLSKKSDFINWLKIEREELKVELVDLRAQVSALKKQLNAPRKRATHGIHVGALMRQWIPRSLHH
jgi:uncharacterized membrane-anchored protein YhcB (DUF1043 family)